MTRRVLSCVGAVAAVLALAAPLARAQEKPREVKPEAVQSASSQEMNSVLDLAKLYFSQGRFEEAQAMLTRAQGIVSNSRLGATPIEVTPEASRPPLPPGVLRVGGNVKPPTKVHDVLPTYPDQARAARIQGIVIIEATIDTQGEVSDARVLRGVQLLNDAALAAVRQWRFTPTLMNGVPVSVVMTVTVHFALK